MSTEASFDGGTLTITRHYDAPREVVFDAWIATSKVQQWWGCAQTTAVKSEIEPKIGGAYNHTMTLGAMGEFPGEAKFTEFDPPKRLAYASASPMGGPTMTVTVDFLEEDGATRVRLTHDNIPEDREPHYLPDIIQAGWTAALGKLGDFLMASAK